MAAMSITRNALFFRLPKPFPHAPSFSLRSSHKPSRLVFATASNYSDWRNAAQGTSDSRTDNWAYDSSTKARREADQSRDYDGFERGRETMSEGVDEAKERTKEYAHEANEKMKEMAGSMADKAKEGKNKAAETAESAKEKAKDAAGTVADKTEEGAHRASETAGYVKDRAKESAYGAKEKTEGVAGSAAETVKQTVQGALGVAKDMTQKIKETVVGKDDDKDERDVAMDEDVELRRRAGNVYDEKKGY